MRGRTGDPNAQCSRKTNLVGDMIKAGNTYEPSMIFTESPHNVAICGYLAIRAGTA